MNKGSVHLSVLRGHYRLRESQQNSYSKNGDGPLHKFVLWRDNEILYLSDKIKGWVFKDLLTCFKFNDNNYLVLCSMANG